MFFISSHRTACVVSGLVRTLLVCRDYKQCIMREISLQCSAGRYLRLSSVLHKLTHEKGKIVVPSPKQNPQDPILSSSQ